MKDHVYHIEEDFHGKDRKIHRKDRKMAMAKDRSKFKKSNQDQLKKHAITTESTAELDRGRVLSITPEGIIVDTNGKQFICTLRGTLKQEKGQLKNLIAIGDFVRFSPQENLQGTIVHIEKRSSVLSRADNLSQRKEQFIAVNIDQVLITMSVVLPALKTPLIDRYIVAALRGNMQPILVINKIDLLENEENALEKTLFEELISTYKKIGIPVFPISTFTGAGVEMLKEVLHEKTSVLLGQSGVGKSSIINKIFGTKLLTGNIARKTNKGSHTTSTAQLIPIEGGGFCVDTPGIKSFGVWDISREELQNYFFEILEYAPDCRFPNCLHLQEPECAVKEAMKKGIISSLRFESYCALMASLAEEHRHR